jgi:hypothetical protein
MRLQMTTEILPRAFSCSARVIFLRHSAPIFNLAFC